MMEPNSTRVMVTEWDRWAAAVRRIIEERQRAGSFLLVVCDVRQRTKSGKIPKQAERRFLWADVAWSLASNPEFQIIVRF